MIKHTKPNLCKTNKYLLRSLHLQHQTNKKDIDRNISTRKFVCAFCKMSQHWFILWIIVAECWSFCLLLVFTEEEFCIGDINQNAQALSKYIYTLLNFENKTSTSSVQTVCPCVI